MSTSYSADATKTHDISFAVEKYELKNGLTVLIHADNTIPIISFQQWFRVGSSHEKPGRTGLAHFFEHLMFKGTTKYKNGEFDKIIKGNGGSNNAFTTEDYTGYYTNLPSDKLELIIDIESDRMRNLVFDEKSIQDEREVVKEERRMRYENSIFGSLYEEIRHTMYSRSEYRWPVIGYMADLNATKTEELKKFYETYYAPNNAVVVIAGDVSVSKTKKLIEKYYGTIPRKEIPSFKFTPELLQTQPKSAQLKKDVQAITLAVVYRGVPADHKDVFALDMLSSVLGSGVSSRLYKRLVYNEKIATQVSMSSDSDKHAGTISIIAALTPGVSSERAIQSINNELAKIKRELISQNEFEKLKNETKLGYITGLRTIASRASALALNEILFSDYRRLFDDVKMYEAITIEDIRRVANEYILPAKRNVIEIVPTSAPSTPASAATAVDAQAPKAAPLSGGVTQSAEPKTQVPTASADSSAATATSSQKSTVPPAAQPIDEKQPKQNPPGDSK